MDLSSYSLEDVILSALKSEVDSQTIYSIIAEGVKNAFLKEKMRFLAEEENKHRGFLETLYKRHFPDKEIELPTKSPVPLPEIQFDDELVNLSEVLESAMEAEKAARDFYNEFSKLITNDPETRKTLEYFATMEWGHYKLLEIERENSLNFESYDEYWPMMHIGA